MVKDGKIVLASFDQSHVGVLSHAPKSSAILSSVLISTFYSKTMLKYVDLCGVAPIH